MPLTNFHPAIQSWFNSAFAAPSPPQAAGWPLIHSGQDTLICAPTGSGKTLTAFMACLDSLFRQGLDGTLDDRTQVVYVSPLKALSNDIQKNLREPLEGIYAAAHKLGLVAPEIRVLVRTGDTLAAERQAMIKRPPHILVTTPESLYILLTAERSRRMLRGARTVIVDEIHAVARDKRGAHLALSLERLDALCGAGTTEVVTTNSRPQRIGLSATQRPVERVAQFLVGAGRCNADGSPRCAIVDLGHLRKVDFSIEIPSSPLEAVCSHETWGEIYERLTELIRAHRTTLIFVNTRRMCERLAARLSERLGAEKVTSHHGSLSRAQRLSAEERLKAGSLSALVATASLELGIDIGTVDLVCQIGVTNSIGTLLQRVGRSGHSLTGVSRGKIFPLTLDELATSCALASAVKRGELDTLQIPMRPLDILAQQIVAAAAAEEWDETALFDLARRAHNYRDLSRAEFDEVVAMLAEGFSRRRGHSAALIHYDGVGKRIRGRRGARLAAITSGGAIPDNADYQVIQEPAGVMVGTLNEDFAVESTPGDIFQLGNTSWKILKIEPGRVRVEDARGQPPSIPFWLGEAPARSDELSREVSRLRMGIHNAKCKMQNEQTAADVEWLMEDSGVQRAAAEQVCAQLAETQRILGSLPTIETLILERFFDESGGMQLVLHAPFGRRVNWAWGLALRKRFCRGFNFELQAAASENAVLLSLGPQHSFPLAEVFNYLKSKSVEQLLVQAMLVAPVFQTRWRWDASRALALLRFSGGKKVPSPLMRMRADDLLAAIFPHAAACPENLEGDREIPDHPLVREVLHDCLHEAMDIDGLKAVLEKIASGQVRLIARDTVEPSPLAEEILTAKPYAFLDDAPLEERRTQAVMRRGLSREDAGTLGALDAAAIARVREEAWPDARDADELHDALMMLGYLTADEARQFAPLLAELKAAGRAVVLPLLLREDRVRELVCATERIPLFEAVYPGTVFEPAVTVPEKERAKAWTLETALVEIVRGRLEALGPVTAARFAAEMALPESEIEMALLALEGQGCVMRGQFTPNSALSTQHSALEWCDRRLLARIHRYTLDRLRSEIEPVSAAEYLRFLFAWQHAEGDERLDGLDGARAALAQLQGLELPAVAWERDVLPARVREYQRAWLDQLSLSGEVSWGRRFPAGEVSRKGAKAQRSEGDGTDGRQDAGAPTGRHSGQARYAPIGVYLREHLEHWLALAPELPADETHLSGAAREVLAQLRRRGAVFYRDLARETKRLPSEIEAALGELVACGLASGDGFAGLRALILPAAKKRELRRRRRERLGPAYVVPRGRALSTLETAGRWSLFRGDGNAGLFEKISAEEATEMAAHQLLRRWGVVFHRIILRETRLPPWRDILRIFRRMEARGELRGGRFVGGFSGEQYALPEAVEKLRKMRKQPPDGKLVTLCGADPLNLLGIITPGERVAARTSTRIVFRDGLPVAIREGGLIRILESGAPPAAAREIEAALVRRAI